LLHETSSLSYTQNGSTDDPSNRHGLSLIHRVSDTPLDAEVPYIRIQPNELGRLKTVQSERLVPLASKAKGPLVLS